MGQAGWALFAIGATPATMFVAGLPIEATVGSFVWWLVPVPLALCFLLLALFPTDARAIRVVCATAVVLFTGFGALTIVASLDKTIEPAEFGFPLAALPEG